MVFIRGQGITEPSQDGARRNELDPSSFRSVPFRRGLFTGQDPKPDPISPHSFIIKGRTETRPIWSRPDPSKYEFLLFCTIPPCGSVMNLWCQILFYSIHVRYTVNGTLRVMNHRGNLRRTPRVGSSTFDNATPHHDT